MFNLFAYGTLKDPQRMAMVTGLYPFDLESVGAQLGHFKLDQFPPESYYFIEPEPFSAVEGVLWLNVPDECLRDLDRYEGAQHDGSSNGLYQRIEVRVETIDNREYPCYAYQIGDSGLRSINREPFAATV